MQINLKYCTKYQQIKHDDTLYGKDSIIAQFVNHISLFLVIKTNQSHLINSNNE